jgi:D-sedoheptulose 7-phosphate isomerase
MDVKHILEENISVITKILNDDSYLVEVNRIIDLLVNTFNNGNAVYFCGNGGSMADASHIAAELSGRFYINRKPLKSLALANNPAFCTAVSNDFSYDDIFSRELEALGNEGDVLVALSTSGNSKNVINAIDYAKINNIKVIGFSGESENLMNGKCDISIKIPSKNTPRVQEAYKLILHIVCEAVEAKIFSK